MTTLKIITHTGSRASDQIFLGMYGHINQAGQFEFDSSLMGLDVAKLTQISIKKGRQSFPESQLHTVEADDDTVRTLKGVLLAACQQRWNLRYDELAASQSPGVASTLESAKEVDAMTADAALEMFGLKAADAPLEMKLMEIEYDYLNARTTADNQGGDQWVMPTNSVAFSTDTLRAVDQIKSIEPANLEASTAGHSSTYGPANANFFSGSAVARMQLPAVITSDSDLTNRVSTALLKMPQALLGGLGLVTDAKLLLTPSYSVVPVMREPAHLNALEVTNPASLAASQTQQLPAPTQAISQDDAQRTAAAFLQEVDGRTDPPADEDDALDVPSA